ncbi:hypothetical protein PACTADRAFT_33994 [Pachysolen tannophilus NRRL Y-2460]|uniref:Uncharacterized protein n=1 Tax=Pachysolen tannophilus NRRL Y-2460 TaxID=669874 RepID=A0A1E4TUL3_PACTA|nr:hypothetical protein PACTADRAFT_33994 [Pachysolen tannophilus NRRL Y-2460]
MIKALGRLNFKRFSSSGSSPISSILSGLNVVSPINKTSRVLEDMKDQEDQVQILYSSLSKLYGTDENKYWNKLKTHLRLFNNSLEFKNFYSLLNKLSYLNKDPPVYIYAEIFRSIFLLINSEIRNRGDVFYLADYALDLLDYLIRDKGYKVNQFNINYLEKIVSSSKNLTLELRFQKFLKDAKIDSSFFEIQYLIDSNQYERLVDKFNQMVDLDPSVLNNTKISNIVLYSLKRQDYEYTLKLLKLLENNNSMNIIEPHLMLKIVNDSAINQNYELVSYCFEKYLVENINSVSLSILNRVATIFSMNADINSTIELIELINKNFEQELNSVQISTILESYLVETGDVEYSWSLLNKFIVESKKNKNNKIILNPLDFENLSLKYLELNSNARINDILKKFDNVKNVYEQEALEIIMYTILKKTHDDTNLTGLNIIIDYLIENDLKELIYNNFKIILHSISRSNSSKIYSFLFYKKLLLQKIQLDSLDYYHLIKSSIYSNGMDNFVLLDFYLIEYLKKFRNFSPKILQILRALLIEDKEGNYENPNTLIIFLKTYLKDHDSKTQEISDLQFTNYQQLLNYNYIQGNFEDIVGNIFENQIDNTKTNHFKKKDKKNKLALGGKYNYNFDLKNSAIIKKL